MILFGWVFWNINHCWNLTIRLFSVISGHSLWGVYLSAEVQSVYSTAPADWAIGPMRERSKYFKMNESTIYIYMGIITHTDTKTHKIHSGKKKKKKQQKTRNNTCGDENCSRVINRRKLKRTTT